MCLLVVALSLIPIFTLHHLSASLPPFPSASFFTSSSPSTTANHRLQLKANLFFISISVSPHTLSSKHYPL
ncbi:hypothetical protein BDV10DRAFT_159193 [Aspergillus recurvatus]